MHFLNTLADHLKIRQEKTPHLGNRYIVLLTVTWFFLFICNFGFIMGLDGVFYTSLGRVFATGQGNVSLFTTFSSFAMAITMLILVYTLDRIEFHHFMMIGIPLASISTGLMSIAPNLAVLYILATLRGIGMGMSCGITMTALIANWYRRKRAVITGLLVAVSTGANALMSTVMANFIEITDYRAGFLLIGVVGLLMGMPAAILMRNTPAQLGLKAYGEDEANALEAAELARAQAVAKETHSDAKPLNPAFKVFTPLVIGMLFVNFCTVAVTTVSNHFPGYAMTLGKSSVFGAEMMTATLFGAMFSQLFCGSMIDKLGVHKTVFITQSINIVIALLLMLNNGSEVLLLVISFLFGTVYSTAKVSQSEWFRSVFGRENFAKAIGVMSFIGSSTTAFSVALIGFVYDLTGSYNSIYIGVMVLDILTLIGYYWVAVYFEKKTGRSLIHMKAGN